MNKLNSETRTRIIETLVEGVGINATAHRRTGNFNIYCCLAGRDGGR
jgi:hypothetical protein